ncbi:MAG: hypothetical protein AAGB13_12065 [Cyanobacteria bacterium P01_F01_bin.33]
MSDSTSTPDGLPECATYYLSPLIRWTILALYLGLTAPLPVLSQVTQAPIPPVWLAIAIGLGGIVLFGVLSERVTVSERNIQIYYPAWMPKWLRSGWSLEWAQVSDLKARSTGQGGLVYYLVTESKEAYLVPMRIAGFKQLMAIVQQRTGLDTSSVRPLAQPWMYSVLLAFTLLLLAADGWVIWVGTTA